MYCVSPGMLVPVYLYHIGPSTNLKDSVVLTLALVRLVLSKVSSSKQASSSDGLA